MSPKKNNIEIVKQTNTLNPRIYNIIVLTKKETEVPDQVFLGLIFGTISGPPIFFPTK